MKLNILKTAVLLVLAITFTSFLNLKERTVIVKESSINWVGKKITGSHEGTIDLSEGVLMFEDDKLVGGDFTIDMTTIKVTDLESGNGKEKLEGHLNSDDFFGTENYKTARFEIKEVKEDGKVYKVTGDLTIKGKTVTKTFDMAVTEDSATANFEIDRTKFDIRYGSSSFFDNLKDKAINDDFELSVNLKF